MMPTEGLQPCTVYLCSHPGVHYHRTEGPTSCQCVDQNVHTAGTDRWPPCVLPRVTDEPRGEKPEPPTLVAIDNSTMPIELRPPRVLSLPIERVKVGDTLIMPGTTFEVAAVARGGLGDIYVSGRGDVVPPLLRLPAGSLVLVRRNSDAPILATLAEVADSSDPHALLVALRAAGLTVEVAR